MKNRTIIKSPGNSPEPGRKTDAPAAGRAAEWPTIVLLVCCYFAWYVLLAFAYPLIGLPALLLTAVVATLHSSLQHETVHGHPSRSRRLNELLVSLPLGLLYPYRRYRVYHLRHHIDARLTDPIEDPESWYLTTLSWRACSAPMRLALRINSTLLGRLTLGPALVVFGLLRSETKLILAAEPGVLKDWLLHLAGVLLLLLFVASLAISPWLYLFAVAYPAMSLLLLRSFIEHRAIEAVAGRTAVIEAGWFMGLLYLHNNLHSVHHRYPNLAWHELPGRWRQQKSVILQENLQYHYPGGYWQVCKTWLLRRREPLQHPFLADRECR